MTIIEQIKMLKDNDLSFSQIARSLTESSGEMFSKDRVQKIYKRSQKRETVVRPADLVRKWLGTSLNIEREYVPRASGKRIIVAVGDLHGLPHPSFLPLIIDANPDIIEVGGDLFDQAIFSAHSPSIDEKQDEFHMELTRLRAWLEILIEKTHAVIHIIRGNHDDRVWRQIVELVPKHLRLFFQDPLDLLVAGLPPSRIECIKFVVDAHRPGMAPADWGIIRHLDFVGDAVISHAHFASAEKFYYGWFNKMRRPMGLSEVSLVVQFHTHHYNHVVTEGGYLTLIEPGMIAAASAEAYKLAPSGKWIAGIQAGITFTQYEAQDGTWSTDYRSVTPLWPRNIDAGGVAYPSVA